MNLGAVLVACLISGGSGIKCYDQLKCYGRYSYSLQYLLCDQSSTTPCKLSYNFPVCSKRKGDSADCSPDWFHRECHCRDLGTYEKTARGSERCECELDKRAVGIVSGLGAVGLLFAVLTMIYSKKFSNMKRAARSAQVEMRVLNRMLETNRNGLTSIEEHSQEEKDVSPPPQYQERNIYKEGDGPQGDNVYLDQENNDIYPEENIYSDTDDTVNIAQACVV